MINVTYNMAYAEVLEILNEYNPHFLIFNLDNQIDKKISNSQEMKKILKSKVSQTLIDDFLHKFRFNFTSQFYYCLVLCIEEALYQPFTLKDIYEHIVRKRNIHPDRLKWGIQKLLLAMIRYTPKKVLMEYIPYTQSPTPKVFIQEIAYIIKKELI